MAEESKTVHSHYQKNTRLCPLNSSIYLFLALVTLLLTSFFLLGSRADAQDFSAQNFSADDFEAYTANTSATASPYTVSSSGAVSVNASWEAGRSSTWYIELQRYGAVVAQNGVDSENDAMIRQGLAMIDWGFAHQVSNGSFAANGVLTAGGDTGAAFHSTVLFIEAAARTALVLKSYAPITYTPDASFYAGVISRYSTKCAAACAWLRQSSVAAAGQINDAPFTHRRYLLAATFAETGTLNGDNSLIAAATPFVQNGLAVQLTGGTQAVTYPDGSVRTVGLAGVNPEGNGFDVSYQAAGILFAERYYKYCSSSKLQTQLAQMIQAGLAWDAPRVSVSGVVDSTGSTRVGIEQNRDGTLKQVNTTEMRQAMNGGYKITGDRVCKIAANRLLTSWSVSPLAVAQDGSVDYNTSWENGNSSTWSISLQKIGADYVMNGISLENDTLIRQGLHILDWGFAHEASDGTFPGTASPFFGNAQFIEEAARVAQALKTYSPVTYQADANFYRSKVLQYQQSIEAGASYLIQPAVASHGQAGIGSSASRWYALAAGLAQAGLLTGDTKLSKAAKPYADHGIGLQWSNGVDQENGTSDVNYQAIGLTYALRYYSAYPTKSSSLVISCLLGLLWEGSNVSVTGAVTGTSSPATRTIDTAFLNGENIIGDHASAVFSNRLEANLSQASSNVLD